MARTKATVRRLGQPTFVAAPGESTGNKNILNRRNSMFKVKTILPQTLQVEVKRNGQVIWKLNVKQQAHYFSGNRKLGF